MRLATEGGDAALAEVWQPPVWLLPVAASCLAAAAIVVALVLCYWCCLRRPESKLPPASPRLPPLTKPQLVRQPVQPAASVAGFTGLGHSHATPPQAVRHGKGLLGSRRGSSASLTISLSPSCDTLASSTAAAAAAGGGDSSLAERQQEREQLKSLSRPLNLLQLQEACDASHALFKEFWSVPMHHAAKCELPEGAAAKNRYPTILPNADTRVTIRQDEYINANYVRGPFGQEHKFIATQGPICETVQDFWQMVWEHNAKAIVMLTDLVERSRSKCELYFPLHAGDTMQHASLLCTVAEVQEHSAGSGFGQPSSPSPLPAAYQTRRIIIKNTEEPGREQEVEHYWFRKWPDHLSPESTSALLQLAECALSTEGIVIVHCSAGLGRTGTFCALCNCISQLRSAGTCDCLGTVCQLRLDRGGMVQSHEQYEFVHRALHRYATSRGHAAHTQH